MDISASDVIATIATLIAILSAIFSYRSVIQAKRANDIGRLNALLSFRKHYLELMEHQSKLAEVLKGSEGGLERVREAYADLDSKLREVGEQLDAYHDKVIGDEI